jgi:hypothetical protein
MLGSTLALADAAGAIQTSYSYEPFGKTISAGARRARILSSSRGGRTMALGCTTFELDINDP